MIKLDHIGIAVPNLAAAVEKYSVLLGKRPEQIERVESQKVTVAMFRAGEPAIELLEGTEASSPISTFIAKRGPGIHHICLRVEDLDATLTRAKAAGLEPIPQQDDRGAGGHRIAFLHPKSTGGVLIELVEAPSTR